ncbi:GNAT family N-acetyltransferase [Streptomyces sp. NBC_01390]|uniref:GNAT family N-acetyltransferase n=1 Tax=Streptomyces sp. NBC_01390 TaxID=2903850 RepID=UPI00386729A2
MELSTSTREDIDFKTTRVVGFLSLLLAEDLGADDDDEVMDLFRQAYKLLELTAVLSGRVAGAIGPMEIRPDAIGTPQLMPQYFGVVQEHRGKGLGRLLWRAAMHWAQTHGAAYQLLQTEVGGSSDRLFRSEGLTSLGFSYWEAA